MCKVGEMLCHTHISKPMNHKAYWDLSVVCVKIHVLGFVRVTKA